MTVRRYLWWTYFLVMAGVLGLVGAGLWVMSHIYLADYVSHLQHLTRTHGPGRPLFPKGQAKVGLKALSTFLHAVTGYLLAIGAAAMVLGFLAFRLVARRLEQPLETLAQAGHAISRGATDVAVAVEGPREIQELSRVFNELVNSLRQAEDEQRQVLEELAHELRTPLQALVGYLQAQRDGVYPLAEVNAWIANETERLSRLADRLPRMTPVSHFLFDAQAIGVRDLLAPIVEMYRPLCHRKGIQLVADWAFDARVLADPDAIREAYHNLFSNAVRHTPEAGTIRLSAEAGPEGYVLIVLEDSGPGVPENEWESIWHHHVRLGPSAEGQGIGLGVVRAIVAGHEGHASVDRSPLGGAAFIVTLPVPPPEERL